MLKAMLPGTFDPPTNGHLDILQRASRLFEAVVVVVAVHPGKSNLFSGDERFGMMKALAADMPNVTVSLWDGLIVDFATRHGIRLIVRGVRALSDFDYEFELAAMNRSLNPRVETVLLPTDQKYSVLRSSVVKDIARFGGTVAGMVPPLVADALRRKLVPEAGRSPGPAAAAAAGTAPGPMADSGAGDS
jgi:pantetheine-phosphate adenylyltransferase